MSQFAFLAAEFPAVHEHAARAESHAHADPRAACFYARFALETIVRWLYRNDSSLRDPYDTTLSARIHEPTFQKLAGAPLWLWDEAHYPPRPVSGFLSKDELDLAIRRRSTVKPLGSVDVNPDIVERFYQTRAIRRVGEALERDNLRRALLVMATGAGKTRTVIAKPPRRSSPTS